VRALNGAHTRQTAMARSTLRQLRRAFLHIADDLGAYSLVKVLTRRLPRILLYHRFGESDTARKVGCDTFDAQIKLLAERFRLISLKDLCASLASRTPVRPSMSPPTSLTARYGFGRTRSSTLFSAPGTTSIPPRSAAHTDCFLCTPRKSAQTRCVQSPLTA
jgi:hypothetical protein